MELREIKGIGDKRVAALNESGIFTPSDLLLRFPDKYIYANSKLTLGVRDGEELSFLAEVTAEAKRRYVRKGLSVVTCELVNNGVTVRCSWFNQPFAARSLKVGGSVYCVGKAKKFGKSLQIVNPTLIAPQAGDGDIIPLYKTSIPSRTFAAAVFAALANTRVNSYIPSALAERYGLLPLQDAIRRVHMPKNAADLAEARRSVAVEQLCYVISTYRLVKDDKRDFVYNAPLSVVDDFADSLPYALTEAQRAAIDGMISAMRSDKLVNMLVQGEVGCGKTAVAMCVMYYAAMSGYQAALMTPTEVLARQHYETMTRVLEPLGAKVQLLCASMSKLERETAHFNIKYGAASCIVGTQSLIGDAVDYRDLRLVIVDEQQRFGVNQRAKLESKGGKTDMIVMTATPIPRTLALSLYGELRQIDIRALPANRPKVHTSLVPQSKLAAMNGYIAQKAALDERTYIICPRITDTDEELTSVEALYKSLKPRLGEIVGCVHGKMKDAEKNAVMRAFKTGAIKVLVSTTVVEVGVDVPEATTVVVYDADRFGLSELHQIRGRVGRGIKESYCFLVSRGDAEAEARLKKFCSVTDGFSVSELDFRMRGAGDFVGLKQHGSGSLEIDERVIERSRALSDALVADEAASAAILRSLDDPEFIRSVTMN